MSLSWYSEIYSNTRKKSSVANLHALERWTWKRIQKSEKQLWAFIKSWGHRIALTKRTNFALKLRFPVNIRDLIFWKLWLRALTLDFHDIHWLESEFHYFGETLMIMFPSSKFAFVSTVGSSSITAKIAAALFHWFCGFFHFNRCLTLLFIVTSRYKVARIPSPLFTYPEFASAGIGQRSN